MKTYSDDQKELEEQTVRVTERYVSEIVVAFDLCPWAAPALHHGRVQISVITEFFDADAIDQAARICDERLRTTPSEIELVLLAMPRLVVGRLDMDRLLASLRAEMSKREGVASFALAAFHPLAGPDTETAERFIPYLRRSPDPLVQAVRFSALQGLDGKHSGGTTFLDSSALEPGALDPKDWSGGKQESLRARIAKRNLDRVLERGIHDLAARLDDICEDRNRTHRLLGLID